MKLLNNNMYLLLIDEETKIGDNNYFINVIQKEVYRNNIENYNVNKDYLKLIIAYYPLLKEAKELNLPKLPNPFEDSFDITKWALEEHKYNHRSIHKLSFILGCEVGYEKVQSKQFSLEDMKKAMELGLTLIPDNEYNNEHFNKFIQSLSTQQLPTSFIPETSTNGKIPNYPGQRFKTIINSENKEEIVGKYQY